MKSLNPKPEKARGSIILDVILLSIASALVVLFLDKYPLMEIQKKVDTRQANTANEESVTEGLPEFTLPEIGDEPLPAEVERHVKSFSVTPLKAGILRPLPAQDIRPVNKQVNAEVGEIITTSHRSQLHIPARAFLDAQGNVVTGKVDVQYREFHDFRDIFLSGIPMHYDSADGYMLESAGMIEFNASQDGRPVYANPQNPVTVMLASVFNTADFNLYAYDTGINRWVYKGKDAVMVQDVSTTKPGKSRVVVDRTADFESAEDLSQFKYLEKAYPMSMQCVSDMQPQRKFFLLKKQPAEKLDFRFVHAKNGMKDIDMLRGITWRYEGADAEELYKQIFLMPLLKGDLRNDNRYVDNGDSTASSRFLVTKFTGTAEIIRNDDQFELQIRRGFASFNLPVKPLNPTSAQYKSFEMKWNKYVAKREIRQQEELARLENFKKDTANFYRQRGKADFNEATVSAVVLRTFTLDGFGIWNCDRPFKPEAPNAVMAHFVDESGAPLMFNIGYMVEKRKSTVYTINDFFKFRFNPKEEVLFWAVLSGNKIAVVRPSEFARNSQVKSGECTFVASISESAVQKSSDLRTLLSF